METLKREAHEKLKIGTNARNAACSRVLRPVYTVSKVTPIGSFLPGSPPNHAALLNRDNRQRLHMTDTQSLRLTCTLAGVASKLLLDTFRGQRKNVPTWGFNADFRQGPLNRCT